MPIITFCDKLDSKIFNFEFLFTFLTSQHLHPPFILRDGPNISCKDHFEAQSMTNHMVFSLQCYG